jgi:hypothetical protein
MAQAPPTFLADWAETKQELQAVPLKQSNDLHLKNRFHLECLEAYSIVKHPLKSVNQHCSSTVQAQFINLTFHLD